jgi:hypothetical protein
MSKKKKERSSNVSVIKPNHLPVKDSSAVKDYFESGSELYSHISSTNIISDEYYKIQNQVNQEFYRAQIEALNNFRQYKDKKETFGNVNEALKWSFCLENIENEIEDRFNGKTPTQSDAFEVDNTILSDFSDKPKYVKKSYRTPLSAHLKRAWFKLTKGPLYNQIKFSKNNFKTLTQSSGDENIKKILKLKFMFFICNWHNTRVSFGRSNHTNFLSETMAGYLSTHTIGQKAITYQDLHPVKEKKLLKWFLNLKYIKMLEVYLHNKYSPKMQNFVLDYVKNDLQFNVTTEELLPLGEKEYIKINKKGKPFFVNRI